MCGISAVINGNNEDVKIMAEAISHRGNSTHINEFDGFAVGYNWLRITDQKTEFKVFEKGSYKCWMNGYISNHKELANKYGFELNTTNDTEVLVNFLDRFKGERLNELNGFFSVLYHDGKEVKCFTDRYGIKQLYKYETGGVTYICSEVKGILKLFPYLSIDYKALKDWKHSLGIMTDDTIYKGIKRVPCLDFVKPEKIQIRYNDARLLLKAYLKQSFQRNRTDLTSGVFLSGGIDSGILAKNMFPDYCFSVDYLNEYSEIENIKLNSESKHYTIIANDKLYKDSIYKCLNALDDLKAGSSYTNYALSEFASKFCTVLFSGAGGDEVFGGYPHRIGKDIKEVIKRTNYEQSDYNNLTLDEYNWRFLKGILVVEDRMASYFTMETRYPFLDNDLVNFALSLPDEYLKDKRILKDISGLNNKVLEGKKRGFSNPHIDNNQWVDIALKSIL